MSELRENITGSNRRCQDDKVALAALENTLKLGEVKADNFDGLFIPGGHGPLFDLAFDEHSAKLILDFIAQNTIAAVCHSPADLLKAADLDSSILERKRVTGFSNAEEVLAMRSDNIPYKLEGRLKELGGVKI